MLNIMKNFFFPDEMAKEQKNIMEKFKAMQSVDGGYYILASSQAEQFLEKLRSRGEYKLCNNYFEEFQAVDSEGFVPYELGNVIETYTNLSHAVVAYIGINGDEENQNLEEIFTSGVELSKYVSKASFGEYLDFRNNFKLIDNVMEGLTFIKKNQNDIYKQGVLVLLYNEKGYKNVSTIEMSTLDRYCGKNYLSSDYILGYVSVDDNGNCQYISRGHNLSLNELKTQK